MKIYVVYDKKGKIISGGAPLPPTYHFPVPKFGPASREDRHIAEFEVPEDLAYLGLAELAERLQVDVKAKPHKITVKGG